MLKNLSLTFMIFAALSCVGTVDKATPDKTDYQDPQKTFFVYQGVADARAISHSKIEVDFFPAGDSETFTHLLYVNDSAKPVELQLETIKVLKGGLYRYILEDRSINTSYKIRISAVNKETGAISEGENEKVVKTFDNTTADFQGASQVIPIPGATSTSVKVDWNPAKFIGAISATAYDPVHYIVTFISEAGGPENLNNPNYGGSDKFEIKVPSSGQIGPSNHPTDVKINSLAPDTTYYFQVRAIHKTYRDYYNINPNDIPIKPELNTIYVTHKTDPPGGAVDFDKDSLKVSKAPGQQAFTGLRATWEVGEGVYTHYRLFVKEFTGGDVNNEDQLDKASLAITAPTNLEYPCSTVSEGTGIVPINLPPAVRDDSTKIACFEVPTTVTNVQINNLIKYTNYQLKVALCRDANCEVQDGATNQAILGNVRYERTTPQLAPFDGINTITQPTTEVDAININFNAVVTSQGYANTLEVYCVDPDNHNNYFIMDANGGALSGTGTYCDGASVETPSGYDLSAINSYGQISSATKLKIKGITTTNIDPAASYCFAITPAITGPIDAPEGDIRMPSADWVVRCIQPELQLPTIEEFPGLQGQCSVNEDNVAVSWSAPTGGLFDDFTLFYRKKGATPFSFSDAKSGASAYTKIENINALAKIVSTLEPGYSYQFGVLAALEVGGSDLYSESNISVQECYVPLPTASFVEWTRIFAIGPKVDGRLPTKDYATDESDWPSIRTPDFTSTDPESRIFEAISVEGIPYEIPADGLTDINNYFTNPPGEDNLDFAPTSPTSFDGALGEAGVAASNTGIISIAWKDVELEFLEATFRATQDAEANDRSARSFGYRVYRSHDYGSSWTDVSGDNLITANDYTYKKRSNASSVTERMAFFTDYSVKHMFELNGIERARIYLYKIVPVYGGKELVYKGEGANPHSTIRVTLPPPNMALVHRKMSNRTLCLEMDKDIEPLENYICEYNGLGARPRGAPWQLNQTVVDQGGDLLVDRFELGCNYTRGELTGGMGNEYTTGASYFDPDGVTGAGVFSVNSVFTGFANNGSVFKGCRPPDFFSQNSNYGTALSDANNPYGSENPGYDQMIYGDCTGNNAHEMPASFDSNPGDMYGSSSYTIVLPGSRATDGGIGYDETVDSDPWDPQFATDYDATRPGLYGRSRIDHTTSQGEFAAVYFNSTQDSGQLITPYGPGYNLSISGSGIIHSAAYSYAQNCFINLAAIGNSADGNLWKSRWMAVNGLKRVITKDSSQVGSVDNAVGNISNSTLDEVTSMRTLYDDWRTNDGDKNFKKPQESLWNSDRLHKDMPLGRVLSSNSAKLPPLTGVGKREFNMICNSYKVQVGLGDESGNFQAFDAPRSKRMMRRTEFIAAGRFPEVLDSDTVEDIEAGSNVTATVNAKTDNACNGNLNNFQDTPVDVVGKLINGRGATGAGYSRGLFITGTGALDGLDYSEACVSKFGLQDLPGNAQEMNTDEIYCDYSPEAMGIYFGVENDPDNSVVSPFSAADADSNHYISTTAWICYEEYPPTPAPAACPNCTWEDPDGDGTSNWCDMTGALKPWKRVTSYAGYCSVVDNDSTKVDDPLNFRDLSQTFEPIYNPDGSLNNSPITIGKQYDNDQYSVDRMRNGDAYFLNFGESNLGPSFKFGGGMELDGDKAKYFNSVTGMPLVCASYGGRESCGVSASDNKDISTPSMWSNHNGTGSDPGLPISNFPVGNSAISNVGLSDTRDTNSAKTVNPGVNSGHTFTRGFIKGANGSVTPVNSAQVGTELGYQFRWQLARGTVLNMYSGGAFSGLASGGYSLSVGAAAYNGNNKTGGRCAVMINEGY